MTVHLYTEQEQDVDPRRPKRFRRVVIYFGRSEALEMDIHERFNSEPLKLHSFKQQAEVGALIEELKARQKDISSEQIAELQSIILS